MPTPVNAHKLILFLLFSSFAVQILFYSQPLTVVLLIGQVISLLIPLLGYLAVTGGGYGSRLGLKPFKTRDVLQGIGITLLLQPFLMLLATVVERIAGSPMEALLQDLAVTPGWIAVMGLAVMPALIEELVFRGFLLNHYRRLPIWSAAILNGTIFGMFHMNLYQFSYAMVLGVFFSVVTRRCGSVIPAMVMHLLNNLISVILIYQLDSVWYNALDGILEAGTTPGSGIFGGVVAASLSLGAAWGLLQYEHPEDIHAEPEMENAESANLLNPLYDWPLTFLVLLFGALTLALPIQELFKSL